MTAQVVLSLPLASSGPGGLQQSYPNGDTGAAVCAVRASHKLKQHLHPPLPVQGRPLGEDGTIARLKRKRTPKPGVQGRN